MKRTTMSRWFFGMMMAPAMAAFMAGCASDVAESDDSDVTADLDIADRVTVKKDELVYDKGVGAKFRAKGLLDKLDAYVASNGETEPVFFVDERARDAVGADGIVNEQSRNPEGYIRRGVSYTENADGTLTIKTIGASMDEARAEVEKVTLSRSRLGIRNTGGQPEEPRLGQWKWDETFGGTRRFDLLRMQLTDKDGNKWDLGSTPLLSLSAGSAKADVRLKSAFISIEPRFRGEVNVDGLTTNNGFAEFSATANSEILFEATATGLIEPSKSGTFHVVNIAGAVGGFPTTLRVDVDWSCKLAVSGQAVAQVGAKASGSISAKASFQDFRITPEVATPEYRVEAIGPALDGNVMVKGRCELTPKLALGVFDAVGPNADLNLWSDLAVDARGAANLQGAGAEVDAKLTAGGQLRFGGGLKPFGFQLLTINAQPIDLFQATVFEKKITLGNMQ